MRRSSLVLLVANLALMSASSADAARRTTSRACCQPTCCSRPVAACPAPCDGPVRAPCICPYNEVYAGTTLLGYDCLYYAGNCGCDGGTCQNPQNRFYSTDTSYAFPQDCADEGVPCDFEAKLRQSGVGQRGLKKPLDSSVNPAFPHLSVAPRILDTAIIKFGPVNHRTIVAKAFLYVIPKQTINGVDSPSRICTIAYEVKPGGTESSNYEVDMRMATTHLETGPYVYYATVGGVTYSVVIAESAP